MSVAGQPRARARRVTAGLFGLLLLLVIPASATAFAQPEPTAALSGPDTSALRAIEHQVSSLRGLGAATGPELTVLDATRLAQYLRQQFDADYLPNERESDQTLWTELGLIAPSDDVVQLQLGLLQAQVLGIYNTESKRLFVVGDGQTFGPAQRQTYAHEFTHALQDQHYDFSRLAPKHGQNNDRALAVHALIEGDAVLLQNVWANAYLTASEQQQIARLASTSDTGLDGVPTIMRTELLFPYINGVQFVVRAFVAGGRDFTAVDALFKRPPTSTAQVLHYDKYLAGVDPVEVVLPDYGPGWRQIGTGVLGELDTRVLLEQGGTDHVVASQVASGWTGDAWQLLARDGQASLVLKTVWESDEAATAFFREYGQGLHARYPAATTDESSARRLALSAADNVTDLRLSGKETRLVIAPDRDTADLLVSGL